MSFISVCPWCKTRTSFASTTQPGQAVACPHCTYSYPCNGPEERQEVLLERMDARLKAVNVWLAVWFSLSLLSAIVSIVLMFVAGRR